MKTIKQFIAITFLVSFFIGGFIWFENFRKTHQSELPLGLDVKEDRTAYMIGRVIENEAGCRQNKVRQCYLLLSNGKGEVKVTYDSNDENFCNNEAAATAAGRAQKGERVESYGSYYKLGSDFIIGTCVERSFYVRILK